MLKHLIAVLLLTSSVAAQEVTPSFGIDPSGAMRELSVRDPTLPGFVPFGILDTTTHSFVASTVPVEAYGARGNSNGTTGNGADDTAAIQACVAISQICGLRPGATYRVTSQITFATRSGLAGPRSATVYADPAGFNNTTQGGASYDATNASVFYAKGVPTLLENISLRGFKFVLGAGDDTTDGRFITGIYMRGVKNLDISDMEITGGPLGFGIKLGSIVGGRIERNYIHDFYEATNPPWSYPQMSAIETDDSRPAVTGVPNNGSTSLKIRDNRIDNILFGGALADLASGGGTDGINLGLYGIKHDVSGNTITAVGEGVDTFSSDGLIANNVFLNIHSYAIKIIHGASRNFVVGNLMRTLWGGGIVMAGGSNADTDSNIITGNSISDINPLNDPLAAEHEPSCFRMEDSYPTTFRIMNTRIFGNYCDTNPHGIWGISRGGAGTNNEYTDNVFSQAVGGSAGLVNLGPDTSYFTTSKIGAFGHQISLASAATVNVFAYGRSNWFSISGTTTITSFGAGQEGQYALVQFLGALTLTHSNALGLPGLANITTAAGDYAYVMSRGGSNATVAWYTRANGRAVVGTDTSIANTWTARQTMRLDSTGAKTVPLALQNNAAAAGTEVCLDMQPNGNGVGVRTAQVCSGGVGSDASLVFNTASGQLPTQSMKIGANDGSGTGGLMVGPSSVTDPGLGRIHTAGYIQITAGAVVSLSPCNAAREGAHSAVTDANSATFNAVVAGGGSNHMAVYCNGTAWVIH